MMFSSTRTATANKAVQAVALAMFVALCCLACANTSDLSEDPESAEEIRSVDDSLSDNPDPQSSADGDPLAQSLDEILGSAAGFVRGGAGRGPGSSLDEAQVAEEERLVEQAIQRCMRNQGFEYTPGEPQTTFAVFARSSGEGLSPEEFAQQRGFAMATTFDEILESDVDIAEQEDPNDLHLESLTEAEGEAWLLALRGDPPQRNEQGQLIDPETGEVIQNRRAARLLSGGCQEEANLVVRGDLELLTNLSDEFQALEDRIAADPRIMEISNAWSACMREAGFGFENEDEARQSIQDQLRPLIFSFFAGSQNTEEADRSRGAGRRGGLVAVLSQLSLTDEQEEELNQLQTHEIAVAVASIDCAGGSESEVAEITDRYEAEFIKENRRSLEEFVRS